MSSASYHWPRLSSLGAKILASALKISLGLEHFASLIITDLNNKMLTKAVVPR